MKLVGHNVRIVGGPHDGQIGHCFAHDEPKARVGLHSARAQELLAVDERSTVEARADEILVLVDPSEASETRRPISARCDHGYPIESGVCVSRSCPAGYEAAPRP